MFNFFIELALGIKVFRIIRKQILDFQKFIGLISIVFFEIKILFVSCIKLRVHLFIHLFESCYLFDLMF